MARQVDGDELNNIVDDRVRSALSQNNRELLADIGSMIDKISNSVSQSTLQPKPKFKRVSNEEQFNHSVNVLDKLDQAMCHIATSKPDQAKERIIEGNKSF